MQDNKNKLPLFFILFCFLSIVDLIGIGMLGPYIALIMDNSKINEVYLLNSFYNYLELNLSPVSFLSILLILVFALRTLVAIFITKMKYKHHDSIRFKA